MIRNRPLEVMKFAGLCIVVPLAVGVPVTAIVIILHFAWKFW